MHLGEGDRTWDRQAWSVNRKLMDKNRLKGVAERRRSAERTGFGGVVNEVRCLDGREIKNLKLSNCPVRPPMSDAVEGAEPEAPSMPIPALQRIGHAHCCATLAAVFFLAGAFLTAGLSRASPGTSAVVSAMSSFRSAECSGLAPRRVEMSRPATSRMSASS